MPIIQEIPEGYQICFWWNGLDHAIETHVKLYLVCQSVTLTREFIGMARSLMEINSLCFCRVVHGELLFDSKCSL